MIYPIKKVVRTLSHNNIFVKRLYLTSNKVKMYLLKNISDETFAKMKYKENTGQTLNLSNPKTYNEKLWWLKLNNRNPLLTVCSDKFEVRKYVEEKGLKHILTTIYGVYDNAENIDYNVIPEKAFIKCNHGSGTNIIYDKEKFNKIKFEKKFNRALKKNYYYQSREWNYKNIKPRIIVEELLTDKENVSLIDYRFMCFDGEVKLILVDINTASPDGSHNPKALRNIYDNDFNYLDIKIGRQQFDNKLISKPKNFSKMIEYAEILSKPFPHCRVDLYNIQGEIYFGEITFYPGGATQRITPEKWSYEIGGWINLEDESHNLQG
ncbi:ATP-grasp fold amidoligase family protein [Sporosarcina sp. FSL W8-0480]|uniref:ATP-grasp fold amidoligase family protein n=1 Tax=Sporosarcina sp. FSL W8-0480 TaxID=2954701 RepID=UPI0030D8C26F